MSTMTASPWTKKATSGEGGGSFELPKGGSYPGCLVALIDLGTQKDHFDPSKEKHKVFLVFELTGEFDTKGDTFKVGKDFTFSLNSKANLRGFLEGWAGRKFGPDEEIDISSFLFKNGVINLTEGANGDKKYVDVSSVNPPMKGLTIPPSTVGDPFMWTFGGHDPRNEPPIPEWVPRLYGRKIGDDIKKAKEWSQLTPF